MAQYFCTVEVTQKRILKVVLNTPKKPTQKNMLKLLNDEESIEDILDTDDMEVVSVEEVIGVSKDEEDCE